MSIDRYELRVIAGNAAQLPITRGDELVAVADDVIDLIDALDEAEAQLRAVRHVLDQHHDQTADGLWIDINDRIPSGDLGNPDKACGKGPCALGDGHPGPCRC